MSHALERKCKAVFHAGVARDLIGAGHAVVDIKPSKADGRRTVFVFEVTPEFLADYEAFRETRSLSQREVAEAGIELGVIDD